MWGEQIDKNSKGEKSKNPMPGQVPRPGQVPMPMPRQVPLPNGMQMPRQVPKPGQAPKPGEVPKPAPMHQQVSIPVPFSHREMELGQRMKEVNSRSVLLDMLGVQIDILKESKKNREQDEVIQMNEGLADIYGQIDGTISELEAIRWRLATDLNAWSGRGPSMLIKNGKRRLSLSEKELYHVTVKRDTGFGKFERKIDLTKYCCKTIWDRLEEKVDNLEALSDAFSMQRQYLTQLIREALQSILQKKVQGLIKKYLNFRAKTTSLENKQKHQEICQKMQERISALIDLEERIREGQYAEKIWAILKVYQEVFQFDPREDKEVEESSEDYDIEESEEENKENWEEDFEEDFEFDSIMDEMCQDPIWNIVEEETYHYYLANKEYREADREYQMQSNLADLSNLIKWNEDNSGNITVCPNAPMCSIDYIKAKQRRRREARKLVAEQERLKGMGTHQETLKDKYYRMSGESGNAPTLDMIKKVGKMVMDELLARTQDAREERAFAQERQSYAIQLCIANQQYGPRRIPEDQAVAQAQVIVAKIQNDDAFEATREYKEADKRYQEAMIDELLIILREIRDDMSSIHAIRRQRNIYYSNEERMSKILSKEKEAQEAINVAEWYYPMTWINESRSQGELQLGIEERGYYSNTDNRIMLSGNSREQRLGVGIHEYAHRFERVVPHMVQMEKEFLEERNKSTGNPTPFSLSTINPAYGVHEEALAGGFSDPYIGKIYPARDAYEILSMGFQYAFTQPEVLLKDPDYAQFVYGCLACL